MEQLLQLVWVFFKIGLFSIGGGYAIIPLIQEQVVREFGWITQRTFTDIITISQMTPGPLAVNTSTFIGLQVAGVWGAILATCGCVVSGVFLSLFLYRFFRRHSGSVYVLEVLNGLKASSLGLIFSAAAALLLLALTGSEHLGPSMSLDWIAAVLFLASLAALRKWKLNPVLLLLITGCLGVLVY